MNYRRYQSAQDLALDMWVRSFKARPWPTGIATVLVVAVAGSGIYFLDKQDRAKRETERLQNLDYSTQVDQLQQTEKSLQQLIRFVAHQRDVLRDNQSTIISLQTEHEKLRPVVQADRATVEAILGAQEQRNASNVWRERIIGFVLGILASLVASFVWAAAARVRRSSPKAAV